MAAKPSAVRFGSRRRKERPKIQLRDESELRQVRFDRYADSDRRVTDRGVQRGNVNRLIITGIVAVRGAVPDHCRGLDPYLKVSTIAGASLNWRQLCHAATIGGGTNGLGLCGGFGPAMMLFMAEFEYPSVFKTDNSCWSDIEKKSLAGEMKTDTAASVCAVSLMVE